MRGAELICAPRRALAPLCLALSLQAAGGPAVAQAPGPAASASASTSAAAASAIHLPASLPFRRESETTSTAGPKLLGGVLVLAAALIGAQRWLRRRKATPAARPWSPWPGGRQSGDTIGLLSSKQLGPGARLHVIEWQGRQYLLADSGGNVTVLDQSPARPSTSQRAAAPDLSLVP